MGHSSAPGIDRSAADARQRVRLAEGRRIGARNQGPLPAAQLQQTVDRQRRGALGAAAGVHVDGRGQWLGASGRADPTTSTKLDPNARFRIGSLSKTFISTLAMQQVEKGQLKLDDKINKWFPKYPGADKISVRQLLNQTSGIPDYMNHSQYPRMSGGPATPDQWIGLSAGMPKLSQPGRKFNYSNTNYTMMSRILEQTGGSPIEKQLRQNIFEPLGMKDTFMWGKESIPSPGMVRGTERHGNRFMDVTNREHPTVA
jgi:D-alanyl-D-alanine carboxypeptidase